MERGRVDQLVRQGFTATTIRLGTRFLDAGDSIVLVGCEDTTECIIEDIIRHTCFVRTLPYIPSYTDPILQMPIVQDIEVGGGILMALPVELSLKLPGRGSTVELSAWLANGSQ
jgi:uncharacterized protein YaaQ